MQFFTVLKKQSTEDIKLHNEHKQKIMNIQTVRNVLLLSQEATILEIFLDDDISDGIEYKLNVVGVRCNSELCVDVLRVSAPI